MSGILLYKFSVTLQTSSSCSYLLQFFISGGATPGRARANAEIPPPWQTKVVIIKLYIKIFWLPLLMQLMICPFIHSRIYIAPLQGNYSEVLPTPAQSIRIVYALQWAVDLCCHCFSCPVYGNDNLFIIFQLWHNDAFVQPQYCIRDSVYYFPPYCTNNWISLFCCFDTLPWRFYTLVHNHI